ncbi:hypothetical protein [Streptomyces sp. NPDC023588]|uniref:hypothetical protein n=1 Tax=Streptomyces sp. NPDC023588 TaxID=3154907 RepID=UPI0033E7645D
MSDEERRAAAELLEAARRCAAADIQLAAEQAALVRQSADAVDAVAAQTAAHLSSL